MIDVTYTVHLSNITPNAKNTEKSHTHTAVHVSKVHHFPAPTCLSLAKMGSLMLPLVEGGDAALREGTILDAVFRTKSDTQEAKTKKVMSKKTKP